jgi:hypothetical protein
MVWAMAHAPRLLLPAMLLERLDPEQQTALLIHELAHIRRRDHWVRILELVATGLYWWHPVVWWARREIHEAEEQCCDAWVVWALAGAGRAYALALLKTVDFFSGARTFLPMAASGIGQLPHLRRRLVMIMQGQTPRSLSSAGVLSVVGLGLLLLPVVPTRAQQGAPRSSPPGTAQQDPRDQQIEVLKQAIKVLEDQKRAAEPARKAPPADNPEVAKLKAEADRLAKEVELKRQELKKAEAALHAVQARLAKVGYVGYFYQGTFPNVNWNWAPSEASTTYQLTPLHNNWADVKYITPNPVSPPSAPGDLEKKLDRLFKEVEELRREVHRNKTHVPAPNAERQPPK